MQEGKCGKWTECPISESAQQWFLSDLAGCYNMNPGKRNGGYHSAKSHVEQNFFLELFRPGTPPKTDQQQLPKARHRPALGSACSVPYPTSRLSRYFCAFAFWYHSSHCRCLVQSHIQLNLSGSTHRTWKFSFTVSQATRKLDMGSQTDIHQLTCGD